MLVKKRDQTLELRTDGTPDALTTVVWTNELGKGNSYSKDDIPPLDLR